MESQRSLCRPINNNFYTSVEAANYLFHEAMWLWPDKDTFGGDHHKVLKWRASKPLGQCEQTQVESNKIVARIKHQSRFYGSGCRSSGKTGSSQSRFKRPLLIVPFTSSLNSALNLLRYLFTWNVKLVWFMGRALAAQSSTGFLVLCALVLRALLPTSALTSAWFSAQTTVSVS